MNEKNLNSQYNNEKQTQQNLVNNGPMEQGVKINGLEQVIEMLRYADPTFRDSLLKRLAQRDPQLAINLKKIVR